MSFKPSGRYALALVLVAMVSGCASVSKGSASSGAASGPSLSDAVAPLSELKCKLFRSSCMFEGSYEPGERNYAEQEAKRLNKAASEKFLRSVAQ